MNTGKEKFLNSLDKKSLELFKKLESSFGSLSQEEKDLAFVMLFVNFIDFGHKMMDILDEVAKNIPVKESKKLKKELREIENTISLGIPGWIKYTRTSKKTKK